MTVANEYVLGTHDEELVRLGLQHRVWRPRVLEAWQAAEIGAGHTVLDLGCGPGYASVDLAEIVGPSGRVVAADKSDRFLAAAESMSRERGLRNIDVRRVDFNTGEFPDVILDRAWARWIFAFVKDPRAVLARLAAALRPGGVLVLHEYFDYATWRMAPRCPEVEQFVAAVMESWRLSGGEPNIALSLLPWLGELGFATRSVRPIVDVVSRDDPQWQWLRSFIDVGRRRLADLGQLSSSEAESLWDAFTAHEATDARMITPAVLEIIATRTAPL
jgi:ubiquinone/menaquinone biosynthesis C-methylase UbiE